MGTFSALPTLCEGNSPVTGEFPSQMPVTRCFDVFFDLHLTNGWVINRDAGDFRRHRAHYDVTVIHWHNFPGIFRPQHQKGDDKSLYFRYALTFKRQKANLNRHMFHHISIRVGVNSIISTQLQLQLQRFQLQLQLQLRPISRISTPTPTPTPEVSTPTPIPTPANLHNINSNSNSNSGGFNSNSNSNSGKYPEYQLQLQFQLRSFKSTPTPFQIQSILFN